MKQELQDSGFRIQDSGFRIQDSGFRIQDSGFRIQETWIERKWLRNQALILDFFGIFVAWNTGKSSFCNS
jgi:hypothetical protein